MTHEAGRKLDQIIAERIFGVRVEPVTTLSGEAVLAMREREFNTLCGELPFYSTNAWAAWKIVDRMCETPCCDGDHFQYQILGGSGHVIAVFHHHCGEPPGEEETVWSHYEWFQAEAPTAPLAICRCALLLAPGGREGGEGD